MAHRFALDLKSKHAGVHNLSVVADLLERLPSRLKRRRNPVPSTDTHNGVAGGGAHRRASAKALSTSPAPCRGRPAVGC